MVIKLQLDLVGLIDPVALQTTIRTAIQTMITNHTLLQASDSGFVETFTLTTTDVKKRH